MPSISPIGNEFLVNSVTTDGQIAPITAPLSGGRFIIVWTGSVLPGALNNTNYANADIRAQIFNADGTPSGSEFVVNTTASGAQFAPAITQLTDGNILIAWQDGIGSVASPASTPAAVIRAQEFTDSGAAVGGEFQIGSGSEAILPAITAVAGGGFVAAWQQGRSGNVVAQVYNNANATVGSQIAIDTTNLAALAQPRLATLTNGNFVIGWANSFGTGGTSYAFSLQVYSTNGTPVSAELPQGTLPISQLGNIIGLASGGFAVASQYNFGTGGSLINFDLFLADGTYGTTTQIAQNPVGSLANVRLAPLPGGGLVATWGDNNATGSQPDIFAQAFNGIGDPFGQRYTLNTTTSGAQVTPAIAALSTGDLIVVWRDDSATGGDTSGAAIRARIVDYNPANAAPTATNANLVIPNQQPNQQDIDQANLTAFATDADGDPLTVSAVANVTNGTVTLLGGGNIRITQNANATDAVSFDYTVSDGNGGTATARARVVLPNDFVTLRGATVAVVPILANDFLQPRAQGYAVATGSPYLQLTGTGANTQAIVNPFGGTTSYYDLPVGQTLQVSTGYNVTPAAGGAPDYLADVIITLQGWAQIGGTGRDVLVGSALADSLQGGTGTANELYGGAGNDYYTVRVQGDTIVENAGEGIDTVRLFTSGTFDTYTLAANVENLENAENNNRLIILGNAENNRISIASTSGTGSVLSGGDGNDTLILLGGNGAELIGGRGDDIYQFSNPNFTVFENANEGVDTVQINNSYVLPANVENLTYTGSAAATLTGNALGNVITGGTAAANTLVGLDGNDTYVVRNAGDSIVETAGGGTDTVQTALSVYALRAANVENLTYTGTGNFTGIGNALNNVITGGAGADYLFAGDGTDTLTGGAGADVFLFDTAVNGIDAITDFVSGTDRLFFNQTVFTHTPAFALVQGVGAQAATTANSTFLYDSTSGLLSYDADGNGAGAAVAVATLSPGLTLSQADFVFYG